MNLTAFARQTLDSAHNTLKTAKDSSKLAKGLELAKNPNTKAVATGVAEVFVVAYALDSFTYVMNRAGALNERDRRLQAFLDATRGKQLSAAEYQLLSRTVPTLRKPTKGETFKAMTKRHVNRAYRSLKITGWAYYGSYTLPLWLPLTAAAWGQQLAVKAYNTVVTVKASPERKYKAIERDVNAMLRRRRMHSWMWRKTLGLSINRISNLYTPMIWKFYENMPEIENGAIVYFNRLTGKVERRISFVPGEKAAQTILERGETEPFTRESVDLPSEVLNDLEPIFTERQRVTFDNEDGRPATARETAQAEIANLNNTKKAETVENWQLILEGAEGYNQVGFNRCQLAWEAVSKDLPADIELDDPRRLGSALATWVRQNKRSQLSVARQALPFWILINLNGFDAEKINDADAEAAFIDFTDESGLLILQGWDDVVAKTPASA